MLKKGIVWVLIMLLYACSEREAKRITPINDFFKARDKAYYHLSPDGKSLSFLKLQGNTTNLFIEDLTHIITGLLSQSPHTPSDCELTQSSQPQR